MPSAKTRPAEAGSGIEVTFTLNWTFGISGPDGRTRYVGPGRVTMPLSEAQAIGGNMATAVYRYQGKRYTVETLKEAPPEMLRDLRKRGVRVPETENIELALTDIEGVGEEMAAALKKAGYSSIAAVAAADAAELAEKVTGVGPKSAPAIIAAAGKVQGK